MKKQYRLVGIIVVIVVVAAVAVALVSMNSSKKDDMPMGTSTSDTSSIVETNSVKIQTYAFIPAQIKVKVGTTVTWTNQDSVDHSVTADTLSADAPKSELFGKGESYSFTFNKAGTYKYHCIPHPYMKGTVEVTN